MAGQPDHSWPGIDEKQTVAEMLNNHESKHWSACCEFIKGIVSKNCADLQFMIEDLIQETIISVRRGLPSFRFESKLKTWVISIALNRANDLRRKNRKMASKETSINGSDDEENEELEIYHLHDLGTPEVKYLINEYLEEIYAEIEKFITRYTKSERNREILHMSLIEGFSTEEIASTLGMKPPTVNAVIRSARLHLRAWHKEHPF